jgi:nucleoside-diphosphate-sugar epimerase
MADASRVALVAGATGVVGEAVLTRLSGESGWAGIGLARRQPVPAAPGPFLEADLLDPEALRRHRDVLARITHVFFATRLAAADADTEARVNAMALGNLLDGLDEAGAKPRHVCLIHGTKWYGCHLGPYRTPAEETDPRHPGPNFYFTQHDLISARQKGRSWTWSTLRPHTVWGYAAGTGNSLVNAIGVYAALARQLGMVLHFPGPEATYRKRSQGITAAMLANAMVWTANEPRCSCEDFNITNGDTFRWEQLWPRVAALFGMECGSPQPEALGEIEARAPAVWREIAERHQLVQPDIERVVNWRYLRGLLAMAWDDWSSLAKLRRYGFTAATGSEDAFLSCLRQLEYARIVPVSAKP